MEEVKKEIRPEVFTKVNKRQRLLFYLQLHDAVWTLPLFALIFFGVAYFSSLIFGTSVGWYDPSFLQPLFLACFVAVGASNGALFIMYFNYRSLHRYFGGKYDRQKKGIVNYFKQEFKELKAWQRIVLSFGVYFFWVAVIVVVFLRLV